MNNQEVQIIKLLLNEMAFEGVQKHYGIESPDIDKKLWDELNKIGAPLKYDRGAKKYRYDEIEYNSEDTVFENCYKYLRIIRNNIIHANKAIEPDSPERMAELLTWSKNFIDTANETDSDFSQKVREIKEIMKIESF